MRASPKALETLRLPLGGGEARQGSRWGTVLGAALFLFLAAGCIVVRGAIAVRVALAAALAVSASVLARRAMREGRGGPPAGWLIVDGRGVHRVERHRAATLAEFGEPLGVTVFASVDRATLRLALTSPHAARYVGARVRDAADAATAHFLIERATTVADEDLRGGAPGWLSAADAERLVGQLVQRAPGALDRLYLSGAGGEPVILDRGQLRVGAKLFDLTAPIEWRAFLFQELGAYAVSVCQATWVRQADLEVVFVASVASEGAQVRETDAAVCAAGEGALVRRALARDARLMQASPGEPPPRELRCAIDRTFMLPVRHALDRAPRAARASAPAFRPAAGSRPEKVG
jgi:hypothetical protein